MQIEHPLKDERFEGKTQTIAANRIVSYAEVNGIETRTNAVSYIYVGWSVHFLDTKRSKNGFVTNERQSRIS